MFKFHVTLLIVISQIELMSGHYVLSRHWTGECGGQEDTRDRERESAFLPCHDYHGSSAATQTHMYSVFLQNLNILEILSFL